MPGREPPRIPRPARPQLLLLVPTILRASRDPRNLDQERTAAAGGDKFAARQLPRFSRRCVANNTDSGLVRCQSNRALVPGAGE
jgi:hypothetical protein